MVMPKFKNLKELDKYLKTVVQDVLEHEVADKVKTVEQEKIQEKVYDVYNVVDGKWQPPEQYDRRGSRSGGLKSRESMKVFKFKVKDGAGIKIVNMAKGKDQQNLLIAPLIEYGDSKGYGSYDYVYNRYGTSWQYLQPRRFTQATWEELIKTKKHVQSMKEGLEKRLGAGSVV